MYHLRRLSIAILLIVLIWLGLTALHRHLDPNTQKTEEEREDARWIATSKYWLDRNACRWMGLCGIAHYHPDPPGLSRRRARYDRRDQAVLTSVEEELPENGPWAEVWGGQGQLSPQDFDGDERVLKDVPQYVLDAAPLIHLYSKEEFWPSDIAEHLLHTNPHSNHTSLNASSYGLDSLHQLNTLDHLKGGRFIYMQSQDDVEGRPKWLGSAYNKPKPYSDADEDGDEEVGIHKEFVEAEVTAEDKRTWFDPYGSENKIAQPLSPSFRTQTSGIRRRSRKSRRDHTVSIPPALPHLNPSGRSPAPAILILVDKGRGILDAFWFYFYSYNLGTTVFNIRFGNHVGDWEHSLIRFYNGVPKAVFFSAHSGGTAYAYSAVEKGQGPGREGRPVLYSAMGSHAMYAMPGKHPYILPFGLLADVTDKGPLWDPALNYYAYHLNTSITKGEDAQSIDANQLASTRNEMFKPSSQNPQAPTSWFWYNGHWGDKFYELRDWRQWRFAGQYHYVNGPLGPQFKSLGRSRVCQSGTSCRILDSLEEGKKRAWVSRTPVVLVEKSLEADDVE